MRLEAARVSVQALMTRHGRCSASNPPGHPARSKAMPASDIGLIARTSVSGCGNLLANASTASLASAICSDPLLAPETNASHTSKPQPAASNPSQARCAQQEGRHCFRSSARIHVGLDKPRGQSTTTRPRGPSTTTLAKPVLPKLVFSLGQRNKQGALKAKGYGPS